MTVFKGQGQLHSLKFLKHLLEQLHAESERGRSADWREKQRGIDTHTLVEVLRG